jgi:hypothetical protein
MIYMCIYEIQFVVHNQVVNALSRHKVLATIFALVQVESDMLNAFVKLLRMT